MGRTHNRDMKPTKSDKTIANIIIKKHNYEVEEQGPITAYTTWVLVDDESTEVTFIAETNSKTSAVEFRDQIAEVVAKYRVRGKVVNPFRIV